MSSYYKRVEEEEELRKYYEAGLLFYKYDDSTNYSPEYMSPWSAFLESRRERYVHLVGSWESYILVEDDAEEATCPSP